MAHAPAHQPVAAFHVSVPPCPCPQYTGQGHGNGRLLSNHKAHSVTPSLRRLFRGIVRFLRFIIVVIRVVRVIT
ncbi:MAG: hypothetical protein O0X49_05400, partial [Methanocorpusculum sp.]|nr:hypothetical protein [Methanocorpusculum sp.]